MNPKEFEAVQNLRLGIASTKENFELYVELYALTAKAKRAFYDSCINEGFSEEQALMMACEFHPFGV